MKLNNHINLIYAAEDRIRPYLPETPLLSSFLLEKKTQSNVWLKLETQLPTGSFKPRPAFNSILSHLELAKSNGVIASSSGNFAQGVAYAASQLSIQAMIVMPEDTSPYKIERTKKLGAEVVLCPPTHESRIKTTLALQQQTGRLLLQAYDSEETIAGDGTIGLEIVSQLGDNLNDNACIIVPVSGGGLLAGIACVIKNLHPQCTVIGVQSDKNASMYKSIQAGEIVNVGKVHTIADALVASSPGKLPFEWVKEYVDEIALVTENQIQEAMTFLINEHKLVVEPGGALPVAFLLNHKRQFNQHICILSGGNIQLLQENAF